MDWSGTIRLRLRRIDRRLPLDVKVALPVLVVFVGAALSYALVASTSLRTTLDAVYAAQARDLASVVGVEYPRLRDDPARLSEYLAAVAAADPQLRRLHVYRAVDGAVVLWAGWPLRDPSERGPDPDEVRATREGVMHQEKGTIGGEPILETLVGIGRAGADAASLGIYVSLRDQDERVGRLGRELAVATAAALAAQVLAIALVLHVLVRVPLRRLRRAAERVAAGDLSARAAAEPAADARDEMLVVAREFDRMVAAVAAQRTEIERLAATDGLTGLLNRRSFNLRLREELAHAARLGYPLTLALVDIDGFKQLNDARGHLAGDEALQRVAAVLASAVRQTDTVARYGGDEFVAILPGSDEKAAASLANRMRHAVEELKIPTGRDASRSLSVSIGLAEPHGPSTADRLIAAADGALYAAKTTRGTVVQASSLSDGAGVRDGPVPDGRPRP